MEASPAFDLDYWLNHCEGFRVDAPGGRLGFVERIVCTGPRDAAESLVVLGGLSGTRRWLVSVADVAVVQPSRERVSLDASPADIRLFAEARPAVARSSDEAMGNGASARVRRGSAESVDGVGEHSVVVRADIGTDPCVGRHRPGSRETRIQGERECRRAPSGQERIDVRSTKR